MRMKLSRRYSSALAVLALVVGGVVATGCQAPPHPLSGQVTSSGPTATPLAGVPVVAYSDATYSPVAATVTGSDGGYSFKSSELANGTYRLRFGDASWWSGASTWATATPVPVGTGAPATVDDILDVAGGGFSGTVDDGSAPLAGIIVTVMQKSTGDVVEMTTTDAGGAFAVSDLYPQDYVLGFVDPSGTMANVVWGAQTLDPTQGIGYTAVGGETSDLGSFGLVGHDCTPGRSYVGEDLSGADLVNCNLSYRDLAGADFSGADLTDANLTAATVTGTNLDGAVLTGATLYYVKSGSVTGSPASLPALWTMANGYLIGPGATLDGAHLDSADLAGASLQFATLIGASVRDADVSGATLNGADLTDVDFTGSDLRNTDLTSATITGVDLSGVDLANSDFTGTDLSGFDLSGADLTGVDFKGAVLTGANLDGTILDGATLTAVTGGGIVGTPASLPAGWKLLNGYLIGIGAKLVDAPLHGADLSGMSLVLADANGADLSDADISAADLRALSAVDTNLSGADLTGSNLSYSKLTGADLTGATLTDVNLDLVDLTGATLTGVTSSGITGTPTALPAGWSLVNGVLVGPDTQD